jgi:hypothetical protein
MHSRPYSLTQQLLQQSRCYSLAPWCLSITAIVCLSSTEAMLCKSFRVCMQHLLQLVCRASNWPLANVLTWHRGHCIWLDTHLCHVVAPGLPVFARTTVIIIVAVASSPSIVAAALVVAGRVILQQQQPARHSGVRLV